MKRLNSKLAGAGLALGLLVGLSVGTVPLAGGALIGLLPTTTSVTAVQGSAEGTITLTATVDLSLVHGALVTPSGTVTFVGTNGGFDGGAPLALGQGTVSKCLLGLPSILGLYSPTCTATVSVAAAQVLELQSHCDWTITGSYSGASDLVAKASTGSTPFEICT
ncbi:MAG TPA: hypothetical protein VG298_15995 [Acidimicrobiales bacterium]|jgi:hypothetical protein|nr:hypothetical protein [Acidimicrobiales bacterium]